MKRQLFDEQEDSPRLASRFRLNRKWALWAGLGFCLVVAVFGAHRYQYARAMHELRKSAHLLSVYIEFDMVAEKEALLYSALPPEQQAQLLRELRRISQLQPESGAVKKPLGLYLFEARVRTGMMRAESKRVIAEFRDDSSWRLSGITIDPDEAQLRGLVPPEWYMNTRNRIQQVTSWLPAGRKGEVSWVLVLFGAGLLLAGYWIFVDIIALPGALIGAGLGFMVGMAAGPWGQMLGLIVGLVLGGAIARLFFEFFIVLFGFSLSAMAVISAAMAWTGQFPHIAWVIIGGVLGAGLVAVLFRWALIALTAFLGAILLLTGLGHAGAYWLMTGAWIVGALIQAGALKFIVDEGRD